MRFDPYGTQFDCPTQAPFTISVAGTAVGAAVDAAVGAAVVVVDGAAVVVVDGAAVVVVDGAAVVVVDGARKLTHSDASQHGVLEVQFPFC